VFDVETYRRCGRVFIPPLLVQRPFGKGQRRAVIHIYEKEFQMSANRAGHLSADVITAGGPQPFRVANGLYFYDRPGIHCIEAENGQGTAFYVYLPVEIQSGSFNLGLTEQSPMIIHVTGTSEAELHQGMFELTVGGDAQFAGSFSGTDADGLQVTNGSFRLEHEAGT
jgi:hypothetical protein